jgi:8-oxo-dGTP pyrophosphatase MutT (NUDIX family)
LSRDGTTVPLAKIPGLDPLRVPALSLPETLPAVPLASMHADALRQRFLNPPDWRPETVSEKKFGDRVPTQASVLMGIVQRPVPSLVLTQRTAHLKTHSGQVALPGGKLDPEDADAIAAALRESQEEVGLDPSHVEVLGTLPVYITGTAFVVTPVVALISEHARFVPNPNEVADVFEVPLPFLMDPANHRWHQFEWEGDVRNWYSMPYHQGDHHRFIWGATAGMLRNLYRFLLA